MSGTAQKIVIPKGMINPDETTVIEIPASLASQPVVVAKRKYPEAESTYCATSAAVRNRSRTNRTVSRLEQTHSGGGFNPAFHSTKTDCCSSKPNCTFEGRKGSGINIREGSMLQENLDLDATEAKERADMQRDLEEFQKARRKLYEHASKIASQDPPPNANKSSSGLNRSTGPCGKSKLDPELDKTEYDKTLYDSLI